MAKKDQKDEDPDEIVVEDDEGDEGDDEDLELDDIDIDALDDDFDDDDDDDDVDDVDEVDDDDDDEIDDEEEAEDEAEEEAEESLDVLLAREQGDDEGLMRLDDEPRDGLVSVIETISPDEFTCTSCFLVKRRAQLADQKKMICFDCA